MHQLISIVIPCYYSEQYLAQTVCEIRDTCSAQADYNFQVILIDDGSLDNTYGVIQLLCEKYPEITGIRLSSNFGQARARMAALPYIRGTCAVFMDDDGQHPANGIVKLVKKLSEGFDLVYADFPAAKESLFRRVTSTFTNICMSGITKKSKYFKVTSFFAVNSFSLQTLSHYHSPYIFMGGYLFEVTQKISTVEIEHRPRTHGTSNYNLKKLYTMWLDNMLAFPTAPAGICRVTGFLSIFSALVFFITAICRMSPTLTICAVLLLGFGIFFILLGFLGEVILRTFCIIQGVPTYEIRETCGNTSKPTKDDDNIQTSRPHL